MPTELFWALAGTGVLGFGLGAGIGLGIYLIDLTPCKHQWERYDWNTRKGWRVERFRCIHCCKRKDV